MDAKELSYYYQLKGLAAMCNDVQSGAHVHEKHNLIAVLNGFADRYEKDGFHKSLVKIERIIKRAKAFLKKALPAKYENISESIA